MSPMFKPLKYLQSVPDDLASMKTTLNFSRPCLVNLCCCFQREFHFHCLQSHLFYNFLQQVKQNSIIFTQFFFLIACFVIQSYCNLTDSNSQNFIEFHESSRSYRLEFHLRAPRILSNRKFLVVQCEVNHTELFQTTRQLFIHNI